MTKHSSVDLVIVAAGRGTRLGYDTPKAFVPLLGKRLIDWTLEALHPVAPWASVTVVAPDEDAEIDGATIVRGGKTRGESVLSGLNVGCAPYVLVHDAARITPDKNDVQQLIRVLLDGAPSASLASPVRDSLRRGDGTPIDRRDLWALQTPQGFERRTLEESFEQVTQRDFTDETALVQAALGVAPTLVPATADNMKITYQEDFKLAERLLLAAHNDVRTGFGYDVHAFEAGDHVTLGGVKIPHICGIKAHSDGDVVFHALADALYGTVADHDIGHHFPPGRTETANMDSRIIAEAARAAVLQQGGIITHVDVMVLAEAPKLAPHRDAMRNSIASALRIDPARVSVKATTTEKLGFIGRAEGLAAQCVATARF